MAYRAKTDLLGRTTDGRSFQALSMSFFVIDISAGERIVRTYTLPCAPAAIAITDMNRNSLRWGQSRPWANKPGYSMSVVSIKGTTGRQAVEISPGEFADGASHIKDLRETLLFADGAASHGDYIDIVNDANIIETLHRDSIRVDWVYWMAPKAADNFWVDVYEFFQAGEIIKVTRNASKAMSYDYEMSFMAFHRSGIVADVIRDPVFYHLQDEAIAAQFLAFLDDPLSLDLVGLLGDGS